MHLLKENNICKKIQASNLLATTRRAIVANKKTVDTFYFPRQLQLGQTPTNQPYSHHPTLIPSHSKILKL